MKAERRTVKPGPTIASPNSSPRLFDLPFLAVAFTLLLGVLAAYSGHFNNPFHFDDDHTIVTNRWVRQLDSFPRFFTDTATSSSLPANQAYRPGVTLLHAIDYRLGLDTTSKEARDTLAMARTPQARRELINAMLQPKTLVFHIHIFTGFVLSGFLLFFVLLHIFNQAKPGWNWNRWLALFGMGWFWLHTANAETINYISARSDSASTFWILLAFVVYFYSDVARRFHLYLLPMIIGFFIKEPALMFAPLLMFYIVLFGKGRPGPQITSVVLSFCVAIVLFLISRSFTPTNWDPGGTNWFDYLLTQAFVIVHYCINFLFPVNLSADTDWQPVTRIFDDKVIAGGAFIIFLVWIIVRCWKRPEWRPVSFGLIWFFIALAPTSSIFPFAEVLNDHRTYFPYIGLIMAVAWSCGIWLDRLSAKIPAITIGIAAAVLLLAANGIGAHVRSDKWSSSYKLWGDCVQKSPGNGRAWMHYGMSLFNKGNDALSRGKADSAKTWYDSANVCYTRAREILPYYSYLYINWGVMRQWQGNVKEAEEFYRLGLKYGPRNPEAYFFLGDFLRIQGKYDEALLLANQGLVLSPGHERLKRLRQELKGVKSPVDAAKEVAVANPTADNYVNLSLELYNAGRFHESALAAEEATKIKPDYAVAWNNICAAYNKTGDWEKAIAAGEKAVTLMPDDARAKNNLLFAGQSKQKFDALEAGARNQPTYGKWIGLSIEWYNAGNFRKCVEASEEALKLKPNDGDAWNNICAAYNKLGEWDKAIAAGEKAVQINPKSELAKNNLAEAKRGKGAR